MSLRAFFAKQSPVKRALPIEEDYLYKRRLLRRWEPLLATTSL